MSIFNAQYFLCMKTVFCASFFDVLCRQQNMKAANFQFLHFYLFSCRDIFKLLFISFSSIISYFLAASGLLFLRVSAKTNKKEEESFVIRFFLCRSSIQFQLKEVSERFRDKDIPFYQV